MSNVTGQSCQHENDTFIPCQEQQAPMDSTMARTLLWQRGYEMVCRFGHLHATKDGGEWHMCLVTDVAHLSPVQFLARLDEALMYRLCDDSRR